jgi:hypothetical protein
MIGQISLPYRQVTKSSLYAVTCWYQQHQCRKRKLNYRGAEQLRRSILRNRFNCKHDLAVERRALPTWLSRNKTWCSSKQSKRRLDDSNVGDCVGLIDWKKQSSNVSQQRPMVLIERMNCGGSMADIILRPSWRYRLLLLQAADQSYFEAAYTYRGICTLRT